MNPYYEPEEMGLEIVSQLDEQNLDYEFNTLCLWKEISTGNLYWAHSSGCSCPTPFEEYDTIASLTPLTLQTRDLFDRAVRDFPASPCDRQEFASGALKFILREQSRLVHPEMDPLYVL